MIGNYLKSFIRFLGKHKAYTINNIVGLSIGMAAGIFIYLWILDELSYDTYHENYDNIYRIVSTWDNADGEFSTSATAAPLAPAFEESLAEIVETARFRPAWKEMLITYEENKIYESDFTFVDKEFFKVFTHPFLRGFKDDPFPDRNSAVVTKDFAEKCFGEEDPVGKSFSLDEETLLTVTGVIENVPANSHLHFNLLLNLELLSQMGFDLDYWENNSFYAYAVLRENVDYPSLKTKIDTLTKQFYSHSTYEFHLQPLSEVHLRSSFDSDVYSHTEPRYQYIGIFTFIGVFIVLLSVINYVNLSTARSSIRAREVGVRKVFGAQRRQLIRQFMGESFSLCLVAYLIGMLLVELLLPFFNDFTGKEVSVNYADFRFLAGALSVMVLCGTFSGAYPSMFLASYIPVKVLQGEIKTGSASFRRVLVIVQFSIAVLMIICTGIVYLQLTFMVKANLGINTDQVIYCRVTENMDEKYIPLKQELLKHPGVTGVTISENLPTWNSSATYGIYWEGKTEEDLVLLYLNKVDHDYIPTFGIEMAAGRPFSADHPADSSNFILNETAVLQMNMEDPVGKRFNLWGMEGNIIGVTKDFNFKSLHKEIEPLLLYMKNPDYNALYGYVLIRLDGMNVDKTIRYIESTWKKFNPFYPLEYTFLDEEYGTLYDSEKKMRTLFTIFATLSIFLSCLGLFGLTSFMAEKRRKEVGIRKVAGARAWQIAGLFSWDVLKWILISNLIAWPIAWLYMRQWLNDFAYKTGVNLWVFLFSALIVLTISVLTISFQSFRTALLNPADSIRYE